MCGCLEGPPCMPSCLAPPQHRRIEKGGEGRSTGRGGAVERHCEGRVGKQHREWRGRRAGRREATEEGE